MLKKINCTFTIENKSYVIFLQPAIRFAVAYFCFLRKDIILMCFYFFDDNSFGFAESTLLFFASWFRQRQGLCP